MVLYKKLITLTLSPVLLFNSYTAYSDTTTSVTTYIVKTQKERESTRFTLTKWLEIKERIKMMDVWLAMFGNTKKPFQPELDLEYFLLTGSLSPQNSTFSSVNTSGTALKGQIWLTNLISSTTGINTINIDFGIEGQSKGVESEAQTETELPSSTQKRSDWTANFRLFGKNIQDSSLVLKYGQYDSSNQFISSIDSSIKSGSKGNVAGAELQLYLFKWLGFEGNYMQFQNTDQSFENPDLVGTYYDYMAYIEISFLQIVGGKYHEVWKHNKNPILQEDGVLAGLKLKF